MSVLAAALFASACGAGLREDVRVLPDGVRFRLLRASASAVTVAGDFNGWSDAAHPMTRSGDLWTSVIRLPAGEHLFVYVVDGTWVTPPNAPEVVPDGFGGWNGRIVVP